MKSGCSNRLFWCGGGLLLVLALLAGCRKDAQPLPGAASEPAAAVSQLAGYLQRDELVAYARASVPPAQYARLEQAWSRGDSRWPLTDLPLDEKLPSLLATLSANGAEAKLMKSFRAQFAGQASSLRQAAHSLGLFGMQYLGTQGQYSEHERAHYVQLVKALSDWATAAPLSDVTLAQQAVNTLSAAARTAGLGSDEDFQTAGMTATLDRLAPVQTAFKQVLASYGLSWNDALGKLRAGLVDQNGDQAMVKVQYDLAGTAIDIQVPLRRIDGHWYSARTLEEVEAILQAADAAHAERVQREQAAAEPAAQHQQEAGAGDQDGSAKP